MNKKILNVIFLIFIVQLFYCTENEKIAYPSKIVAESFLVENDNIYGISKIYDQNNNTSFSFGLNGNIIQKIIFTFETPVELSSFEIVNGFQETEEFYDLNSRVSYISIHAKDNNIGITENFNFKIEDKKERQKFNINLIHTKLIDEIIVDFNLISAYKGKKYKDVCFSEMTFLKRNNHDKDNSVVIFQEYLKSIQYKYSNNFESFFSRKLYYKFFRGGKVLIDSNEMILEYIYTESGESLNNGLKGKFKLNGSQFTFSPTHILVSKGLGEDYNINWVPISRKQDLEFQVEQEKCFIKLIPKDNYEILKTLMNYIKEWKEYAINAPGGEYIPIVIQ